MADKETVAVVEGPKGSAKIIEVWGDGRLIEHQVEMNGHSERAANLGEAYIIAGEKVGKVPDYEVKPFSTVPCATSSRHEADVHLVLGRWLPI